MRKLILSVLIASCVAISVPLMAASDLLLKQQEASLLYQNGDYKNAYSKYRKLARDGDGFSQYRVSYMNLMGQGGKEDVIESLAWAVLAAQSKQEYLVDYMQAVADMVPDDKRKKADKKVTQYLRKWGNDIGSAGQKSDNECTGTRLCNHAKSPKRVHKPSNLWTRNDDGENSGADASQRMIDLNQSILELYETPDSPSASNHETG